MKWILNGWRRRKKGVLRLYPDPVLRDVTWDRFERACIIFGVDADEMFAGRVTLPELKSPPLSQASEILDLLLENAHAFDVKGMAPDRLAALLAVVVAEFFFLATTPASQHTTTSST